VNFETVNAFLVSHHLVPLVAVLGFLWKVVRPIMVDMRAVGVEFLAMGRAAAVKNGITEDMIAQQRPIAERAVPNIPDDAGALARLVGSASSANASAVK
jgi:hypothetical protein